MAVWPGRSRALWARIGSSKRGIHSQRAGRESCSYADGSEEEDILVAFEEADAKEVADAVGEVFVLAAIDLVLERKFKEVEVVEEGFLGMGGPIWQGGGRAGELEAL